MTDQMEETELEGFNPAAAATRPLFRVTGRKATNV